MPDMSTVLPSLGKSPEQSLWFYANNENQPIGPLPFDELRRLLMAGTINAECYVVAEGETEWRPLNAIFAPASAPPNRGVVGESVGNKPSIARSRVRIFFWAIALVVSAAVGLMVLVGIVIAKMRPELTAGAPVPAAATSTASSSLAGGDHAKPSTHKAFRKSDFLRVFDGSNAAFINDVAVENLADMVEAVYAGRISPQEASRYAFRPNANEGVLRKVVDQYLIFEVSPQGERTVQFAMRRDPAFEREQAGPGSRYRSIEEYYSEQFGAEVSSDGPLARGPVVIIGMTQFVTGQGLVKMVPIVELVDIQP